MLQPDGIGAPRAGSAAQYAERISAHKAQLKEWADNCPRNYLCTYALVCAEEARIAGDIPRAGELYEQAIRAAREDDLVHLEGLSNELCARFYLGLDRPTTAKGHLNEAHACYTRWGADGKVRQLEQRYPELLERKTLAATQNFAVSTQQLDILSVLKASQSISSEIVLPKLVETLTRIVIESAGAQKGYLIRRQKSDWSVEVEAKVGEKGCEIDVLQGGAPIHSGVLPEGILNYVKRTREQVVLDDAALDARFSADEYIARKRPRSVLCLPIVRQTELVGLFYLENNLTTGAFTPDRLAVLIVLLDLKMPGVDGMEVLKRIRSEERTRRLPVIILSSSGELSDVGACYDFGANSYIRKRVDILDFTETMRILHTYWTITETPPLPTES
ncbi:MAG TPA: response regulator [Polyangiaceae bacterium]|nr:response regulator [Polyangiaceae bacterium]